MNEILCQRTRELRGILIQNGLDSIYQVYFQTFGHYPGCEIFPYAIIDEIVKREGQLATGILPRNCVA